MTHEPEKPYKALYFEQKQESARLRKRNEMLDAALAGNCSFAERMEAENARLREILKHSTGNALEWDVARVLALDSSDTAGGEEP